MVIELAYVANMHAKSLSDIGKEAGGISGSAVGYVHKRMRQRLGEDPELNKKFIEASRMLSIL